MGAGSAEQENLGSGSAGRDSLGTGPPSPPVPDYGPYRRSSGDGLLGAEWPRAANFTGICGIFNDDEGVRRVFSITLTSNTGHTDVPFAWFEKLGEFIHVFCHRAAIGLERGGNRRILHVQAVMEVGIKFHGDATKVTQAFRERFRRMCGLVGAKLSVKELDKGQTLEREFPSLDSGVFVRCLLSLVAFPSCFLF